MSKKSGKKKNNTLVMAYVSPQGTIKHVCRNAKAPTIQKYDKAIRKITTFKLLSSK